MSAAPTLAADLAIAPGGTIGIVGAGQLGRMMALAARSLGYRVHVLTGETEPGTDTPAGPVSDRQVHGSFSDELVLQEFVAGVDIVTFEFENVDTAVDDVAAQHDVPVRPGGRAVRVAQHRGREKDFLTRAAIPVAPYVVARSAAELAEAIDHLGGLVIAKTAAFGYDGKGQVRIAEASQAAAAWTALGVDEVVVESVVPFVVEVSVVVARSITGETADYGPIENRHVDGILDTSAWPSCLAAEVAERARSLARSVARALDYVGILAVEMFVLADHSVLVNEIAPRPHNSGHLTIEAAATSQFEQHVRAVCGLPLGSTEMRPAAMANLLGDIWAFGPPQWSSALADPAVHLHLYGKSQARPGRKMGHLTVLAESADDARARSMTARSALNRSLPDPGVVTPRHGAGADLRVSRK